MKTIHRFALAFMLLFFLAPKFLPADTPDTISVAPENHLNYRVLESGQVLIWENQKEVAQIAPEIFTEGWKYHNFDIGGSPEKWKGFTWKTVLEDGSEIGLQTTVKVRPGGLHIRYILAPRKDASVIQIRMAVNLPYSDWEGAAYGLGPDHGTVPPDRVPNGGVIAQADLAPLTLEPAPAHEGLSLKITGQGLHLTLQDNRQWSPFLLANLTHGESPDHPWPWKAGEKKTYDFTVTFDRPVDLKPMVPEPKRPFPYQEEEVTFLNAKDNVSLSGTLTFPKGKGPFPAVLLVCGSGRNTRDEPEPGGHNTFLVLSDYLTRQGFAVLRYDKRGVGESGGNFSTATTADFAGDAAAGFEYLRSRKEVDPRRAGLIGHSEGGYVAPLVAAKFKDTAFLVLMAGPAIDGKSLTEVQMEKIWKADVHSDSYTAFGRKVFEKILDEAVRDQAAATAQSRIHRILQEETDEAKREFPEEYNPSLWSLWFGEATYLSPWWRYYLRYDPRAALQKVSCPVLAVNGDKDLWVPADANWPALERNLKEGHNPELTTRLLPGLNHLFQTCRTGLWEEFALLPETMAPQALDCMAQWIKEHTEEKR